MSASEETNFALRFRFGLSETAATEDKRDFLTFFLAVYRREEKWTSDTLSEYLAGEFRHFFAEDLKIADPDDRRKLRDLLRDHRVYVPKVRSILISNALHGVVKEDLPWPENDREEVRITDKIITRNSAENDVRSSVQESFRDKMTILMEKLTNKGNLSSLIKTYSSDDDQFSV